MYAVREFAQAKQALSTALRLVEPKLLFREIQVISEFYVPSRLMAAFVKHYPEWLRQEYHIHKAVRGGGQRDMHKQCYNWIRLHAHEYPNEVYQFYLDNKHWLEDQQ